MAVPATFTVERDGERVQLVPEFWPSDLDADARNRYDDLRELHVVEDGALSMPENYLPDVVVEPGSAVSLDAVWRARNERLGAFGVGLFPGADEDRERIARALLEAHDDCRG